jgi:hypothetical protein
MVSEGLYSIQWGAKDMYTWEQFEKIWKETRILRHVDKALFTFGDSYLPYFLVARSVVNEGDTVIREGEVIVKKPVIITPTPGSPYFEGFGEHEKEASRFLISRLAYIPPYRYTNSSKGLEVCSESIDETVNKLGKRLDKEGKNLVAIIHGRSDHWEITIMRYSVERMIKSLPSNITELRERGFLDHLID